MFSLGKREYRVTFDLERSRIATFQVEAEVFSELQRIIRIPLDKIAGSENGLYDIASLVSSSPSTNNVLLRVYFQISRNSPTGPYKRVIQGSSRTFIDQTDVEQNCSKKGNWMRLSKNAG